MSNSVYLRGANLNINVPEKDIKRKIRSKSNSKRNPPPKFIFKIEEPEKNITILNYKQIDKGLTPLPYEKCKNNLRCMYTTELLNNCYPIGIPIATSKMNGKMIYQCVGAYGTFNAALAELRNKMNGSDFRRYENSEKYLMKIFHLYYPDCELKPLLPKEMLDVFNGPFTLEEFYENVYRIENPKEELIIVPMAHIISYVNKNGNKDGNRISSYVSDE